MTDAAPHILLICTVGGSADPILFSLNEHKPERVIFIASGDTKPQLTDGHFCLPASRDKPPRPTIFSPANASVIVVEPQEFPSCLKVIRSHTPMVEGWLSHGVGYKIVADITGGTKVMSAALALAARNWKCDIAYVAGKDRGPNNTGTVESGSEDPTQHTNPWAELGYETIDQFKLFFNKCNFGAAKTIAEEHRNNIADSPLKTQLAAMAQLAEAYECWEGFDHLKAEETLRRTRARQTDSLIAAIGAEIKWQTIDENLKCLQNIKSPTASLEIIADLIANAERRAKEARYDDAVARLYRATEAIAQYRLMATHSINAGEVAAEQLPQTLQTKWAGRFNGRDYIKLALQDDYELLCGLGDPLGVRFFALSPDPQKSWLNARNDSILAHGFHPVRETTYKTIKDNVDELYRKLVEIADGKLIKPEFPTL